MSAWTGLRMLVYLRRIASSLDRSAAAMETMARIETDRSARESRRQRYAAAGPIRKTEFGSFSVEEANERWRKEQEAAEIGVELEG